MDLAASGEYIPFKGPLVEGKLLGRDNRFLARVELSSGEEITAHCANTGSMRSCFQVGDRVLLSHQPDPSRKLHYSWELTQTSGGFIGVNTAMPNQVVFAAIERGLIVELAGYASLQREVRYGRNSRIDVLLVGHPSKPNCYVEVKNTTLLVGNQVQFPDSVTERGQKHLIELAAMVKEGFRSVMLFFINRPEGDSFSPADDVDPQYGKLLRQAAESGVELLAYRAESNWNGIKIRNKIPIVL